MFRGRNLAAAQSDFPFMYDERQPLAPRLDAICAISVAFFRESACVRMGGNARVYFPDGVLYMDGRMRDALPNGQRAATPVTFVAIISRAPHGVQFRKFGPIGSVGEELGSMVRGDGRRIYLVLDEKGRRLETMTSCEEPTPDRCPEGATFAHGGARWCAPYISDMIATLARVGGSADVRRVAPGPHQQHDAEIAPHLGASGGDADLRNACAMTFCTTEEGAERNPISTTMVGAEKGP